MAYAYDFRSRLGKEQLEDSWNARVNGAVMDAAMTLEEAIAHSKQSGEIVWLRHVTDTGEDAWQVLEVAAGSGSAKTPPPFSSPPSKPGKPTTARQRAYLLKHSIVKAAFIENINRAQAASLIQRHKQGRFMKRLVHVCFKILLLVAFAASIYFFWLKQLVEPAQPVLTLLQGHLKMEESLGAYLEARPELYFPSQVPPEIEAILEENLSSYRAVLGSNSDQKAALKRFMEQMRNSAPSIEAWINEDQVMKAMPEANGRFSQEGMVRGDYLPDGILKAKLGGMTVFLPQGKYTFSIQDFTGERKAGSQH